MAEDLGPSFGRKRRHVELEQDGKKTDQDPDQDSESDSEDDIGPALPSAEAPK